VSWTIRISRKVKKKLKKGTRNFTEDALEAMDGLFLELETLVPAPYNWPNYGKLRGKGDKRHCHLARGRPTYVGK